MGEYKLREGMPHLRGAAWDGDGVNFSLFSARANARSASAVASAVKLAATRTLTMLRSREAKWFGDGE